MKGPRYEEHLGFNFNFLQFLYDVLKNEYKIFRNILVIVLIKPQIENLYIKKTHFLDGSLSKLPIC